MQVEPIKPTSKAPGTKRLTLKYDEPLSNFAFKFNLRRYTMMVRSSVRHALGGLGDTAAGHGLEHDSADGSADIRVDKSARPSKWEKLKKQSSLIGRGSHSSTFQPNLSRFGHTSSCTPAS